MRPNSVAGQRVGCGQLLLSSLRLSRLCPLLAALLLSRLAAEAGELRIHCTPIAAKAFSEVAAKMREQGIEIKFDTEGGSSLAIAALAADQIDIALTIRPTTAQERSVDPEKRFAEEVVAYQTLAVIVSADVWESGVRAIGRDQAALVYEERTTNWKQIGGDDRAIKFYNPQQGIGLWEPFVTWVYGDLRKAGLGSGFESVTSAEDARNSVEFNGGSMSVAPIGLVDSRSIFALALKDDSGAAIAPTMDEIVKQRYPLSRPIVAIASRRPTGDARKVLLYMHSEEGQEILKRNGLVPAPADAPLSPAGH